MIASAPGKVIIFGEHSVVYGKHAVVSSISKRCYVKAEKHSDFVISSQFGRTKLDFSGKHSYISYAIKRFSEVKKINGAKIIVNSEIPPDSGLGSSAAVTVATLTALNAEFEAGLSSEQIFELAKAVEIDVQGIASGIDPFICTYGGNWVLPEKRRFETNIEFGLIESGESSVTAEMVKRVAELRKRYPNIVNKILDTMDYIAIEGAYALEKNDVKHIETLFKINQSLLRALGVSTPNIDRIIADLEKKGCAAKITGAGGGGMILTTGCGDKIEVGGDGVRIEDN